METRAKGAATPMVVAFDFVDGRMEYPPDAVSRSSKIPRLVTARSGTCFTITAAEFAGSTRLDRTLEGIWKPGTR